MTDATDPHRLRHLRGCHPELKWRVTRLVEALEHEGLDILITQGVRSAAQQASIYSQGRTRPGKISTNCDGTIKISNHQVKSDGFGYAVDVAWRTDAGITWEGPWDRLGILANANGLTWPIYITSTYKGKQVRWPDLPHLELPPSFAVPSVSKA